MIRWLLKEAWEKINIVATWRTIKALGKKYGKRFFWAALIWEIIEDVVFPFIAWKMGVPELIPVFLVLHFEPIVYPAFFWGFKTWDRIQGKEPWEPDREAHSSHWRSVLKGLTLHMSVTGWLSQAIPWKPLVILTVLMSFFGFIHERIWHDTNYGIAGCDQVEFKRVLAKTGTYILISTMTLYPLLKVTGSHTIWQSLLMAQGITGTLYLILESVWAKSKWGVRSHSPAAQHDRHEEAPLY
jgi:hypothetical protein